MGLLTGFLIGFLSLAALNAGFCNGGCIESERQALLKLKHDMDDPAGRLASWVADDEDCCRWKGVVCNNVTGHVLKLNLRNPTVDVDSDLADQYEEAYERWELGGKISPSFLTLKHLRHLDLSNNNFGGINIPKFVGSLRSLRLLNLSTSKFVGEVPHHLGNLSNLKYLDLGGNVFLQVEKFHWLSGLSSLQYLDMSDVNLSKASNWFLVINTLPSLLELHLADSGLGPHDQVHPITNINLSSLDVLDLSDNPGLVNFSSINWVFGLKKLIFLDLSENNFEHSIPYDLQNLTLLRHLDLSSNSFNSIVPNWSDKFSHLEFLDLSYNKFNGEIPIRSIRKLWNLSFLSFSGVNLTLKISSILEIFSECISNSLESLQLDNCQLSGQLTNQLGNFKILRELSISQNSISGPIPTSIAELQSLKVLDFSSNELNGSLPESFGQLVNLEDVDISNNSFDGRVPESFGQLTNLKNVDISHNYFDGSLPESFGQLANLEDVDISNNSFDGRLPESFGQLVNLKNVDISYNSLDGSLPESFGQLVNLKVVDISHNSFDGSLPESFSQLANLKNVDISYNSFDGSLPESFGQLVNLKVVDISHNSFDGNLPESFGQLANLEDVYIFDNSFEGTVSEIHFINLTKLKTFVADGNPSMILKVNPNWLPDFQVLVLRLGSWHLGPQFPQWLHSQKYLNDLDISNSSISDTLPDWFWEVSSNCEFLNISHNQIHGQLPSVLNVASHIFLGMGFLSCSFIDFSSNNFTGQLGRISPLAFYLDLSRNNLSGSLFTFLCREINESMAMNFLNLGENFLSGELPDCWTEWPELKAIVLTDNRLTGEIPRSIGALPNLIFLNLEKNYLSGEIPLSISNCTKLEILQLGENELDGSIPPRMGHSLGNLKILKLDANKLSGHIPNELCSLVSLQILDLAHNNLFGSLPRCIGNISVLLSTDNHSQEFSLDEYDGNGVSISGLQELYHETLVVWIKGQFLEYGKILYLVKIMDFSGNCLSGEIPSEITHLQGLQSLNLSHNLFTGRIPENIGNMRMLESADFSANKLSGPIPESMSSLTFLSYLNLSNNQLTGRIPSSTQLQTFNAASFTGNKLCGFPLPNNCTANGNSVPSIQNRGGKDEIIWLFVSIALGFIVGFWSVLSPLVISRRWRRMYYQFLEEMWWKISDSVKKCF